MNNINLDVLRSIAHSPIRNYAIPGLTSYLIGTPSPIGTLRLFVSEREHVEPIVPHSHRYSFACTVIKGRVRNRKWSECRPQNGDLFNATVQKYDGHIGEYTLEPAPQHSFWTFEDTYHNEGETYTMLADEIHSIYFARDTYVLFFEGPQERTDSIALLPVVDNEIIPSLDKQPWMFRHA